VYISHAHKHNLLPIRVKNHQGRFHNDMTLSSAMQEYLAEAYRLAYYQPDKKHVSTSALADVMQVSAPAVTRMVQRLKDAGYLEHEPYQGIYLTAEGEREALLCIRRHRLVERFLVDVMGFGWHEVHTTADELGENVSDKVVARMESLADYPRRCPHGEPIPTSEGIMPEVVDRALTEVSAPADLIVSRANSHDEEKLKYLDSLQLKPGARFTLVERAPFNGPLTLEINGQRHFIGHELAGVLRVSTEAEFAMLPMNEHPAQTSAADQQHTR
jgi:DtxR family transcriptional regulator, Mn-dependent transcriptional regulator